MITTTHGTHIRGTDEHQWASAVTGYCFDTDIVSATIRPAPPLHLVRRLATVAPQEQFTTSITVGELIYGARRVGREEAGDFFRGMTRAYCSSIAQQSAPPTVPMVGV